MPTFVHDTKFPGQRLKNKQVFDDNGVLYSTGDNGELTLNTLETGSFFNRDIEYGIWDFMVPTV